MNRAGVPVIHGNERIILDPVSFIIQTANLGQNCTNQPTKHEVPVVLFALPAINSFLLDINFLPIPVVNSASYGMGVTQPLNQQIAYCLRFMGRGYADQATFAVTNYQG